MRSGPPVVDREARDRADARRGLANRRDGAKIRGEAASLDRAADVAAMVVENRSCGFFVDGSNWVEAGDASPSELIDVPSSSAPTTGERGSAKSCRRS